MTKKLSARAFAALAVGSASAITFVTQPARAAESGDRPAVVRGNLWLLRSSLSTGAADLEFRFGEGGDTPVFGDWDGDGDRTPGVIRGNVWFLRNSNSTGPAELVMVFGQGGDRPIVGDWDGDGDETPGVVRGNEWFLRNETTSGFASISFTFGNASGDIPIVGDWDDDGDDNPGVVRAPSCNTDCTDEWFLRLENSSGGASVTPFAAGVKNPAPGDWDGDGASTAGWIDGNEWFLHFANRSLPDTSFRFGEGSDTPLVWRP